ncbi:MULTISPECIES: molybdopterin-dependent oxidoreductase [Catenuloplanes]|uniref:DMSO/TMAO reductase YedYZ molybdopterin-dependent catalytic subunit n=1 Tax=Catenuloplanes niger TaxID=587534 RepID=A0AAE3ZWA2_9ACTN|nr:molybdopterin-dependent oxidoreductase [Catenuloplanes niger]MDR7327183.1 DMSO/TMAO reductase YedYZ molybdopterin-dependent catalytic subunit [Catenuloplanes niger]
MRWRSDLLSGLIAAGAGVAAGELLAAAARPGASPVLSVGAAVIDATPTPVKEFAVRTAGTADKPLLLTGIAILTALLAAALGIAARRRPLWGVLGFAAFGVAGAVAAVTRPGAESADVLPSALAGLLAAVALTALTALRPGTAPPAEAPTAAGHEPTAAGHEPDAAGHDLTTADHDPATPEHERTTATANLSGERSRRGFLTTATALSVGAVVAGGLTGLLRRRATSSLAESRAAVRLPAPAEPAPPLPPGTPPDFLTRNADFYRVDTALTVPRIDPADWRLRIHGMVRNPVTLSLDDLLRRRTVERFLTLTCVSNEVGGPYTGTARWLGVPLAALLDELGVDPGADQLVARGADGMTIGTPTRIVRDGRDAMLAVGMNGEPLPVTHGFPVRMLTPGLYGYAGSCKWITELELTTFAAYDAYWVERGWAAEGPAKTASRIDRPAPFTRLESGTNATISGVAWALHTGIASVEVQIDDGPWQAATVLPPPSDDTWVQWRLPWKPAPGGHTLRVRATDRAGAVQTDARATPFPDGATGRHTISVSAV